MRKCTLCGSSVNLKKFRNGYICENCIAFLKNDLFPVYDSIHLRETTQDNYTKNFDKKYNDKKK